MISTFSAGNRCSVAGDKGHGIGGVAVLGLQDNGSDNSALGQFCACDLRIGFQCALRPLQTAAGDLPAGELLPGGRSDGGSRRDALIDGGDGQGTAVSVALVAVIVLREGHVVGVGSPDGDVGGALRHICRERLVGATVHLAVRHVHPALEGVAGQGDSRRSGESVSVFCILHHISRVAAHTAAAEPEGDGVLGVRPHGIVGLVCVKGHVGISDHFAILSQ